MNYQHTRVKSPRPDQSDQPATLQSEIEPTLSGYQKPGDLTRRRVIFSLLNLVTYAGLVLWLGQILGTGGWSIVDIAIFACFAVAAPWGVLGIWNALIGLWLLHAKSNAMTLIAPFAVAGNSEAPIRTRTAIVMTICNEAPERALARLEAVRNSLNRTSTPDAYSYFLLSDTNDAAIAEAEEAAFASWKAISGSQSDRLHYRRRASNIGFKAGNLREFCDRWGDRFEFFLPLDADSLMSGRTIEKMVRIAQAWPNIGILQSLAVGAPSASAFARIFQFGMRQGMRPYTIGSTWWSGDCGPFWGHNALVRMAPFRDHCVLPQLQENSRLGGRILSHDQVEAVLMRRAGFEVRVLPEEGGSWEDNPPNVIEFMRRDSRWCEGNMQYLHLMKLRGIKATSRFQLVWAVMMFVGLPAWTAIIALSAFKPLDGENPALFPAASALAFYTVFLAMFLAPKLAGYIDIALTRGEVARYGGPMRFATGALIEIIFSFLVAAVVTFRTSVFMAGLLVGRRIGWAGQTRDGQALRVRAASAELWPQLVFGIALFAIAVVSAPVLILVSLPLTLGYIVGIPFAMVSASPKFGAWAQQNQICAIPEELSPPMEIKEVFGERQHRTGPVAGLAIAA